MNNKISFHKVTPILEHHCVSCNLNALCITDRLDHQEILLLESIVRHPSSLSKGATLYSKGERFQSVFIVKSGCIKTQITQGKKMDKVTRFYFPGDLIGLNAVNYDYYYDTATAIETSSLCQVSFEKLDKLSAKIPSLRRKILHLMSRTICDEQKMVQQLTQKNAEERIAAFLLSISNIFKVRGFSDTRFRLSMSRIEIGSYLGLTVETVSRALSRLHKIEYLVVDKREITILDFAGLYALSSLNSRA